MDYFQFYGVEIPTRCFVGGLPYSMTELEMNKFFSQFGCVKDSKIITDRHGVSKGYGFVTFKTEEEAAEVCAQGSIYYKEKKLNISKAIRRQGGQYSKANQEYINGLMLYQTADGQLLTNKNGSWVVEERSQFCQPSKPYIQPFHPPLWSAGTTPYLQTSTFYQPLIAPQPMVPLEMLPRPPDPGPLLFNYDHNMEVAVAPPPPLSLQSLPLHNHPPPPQLPPPPPPPPPPYHPPHQSSPLAYLTTCQVQNIATPTPALTSVAIQEEPAEEFADTEWQGRVDVKVMGTELVEEEEEEEEEEEMKEEGDKVTEEDVQSQNISTVSRTTSSFSVTEDPLVLAVEECSLSSSSTNTQHRDTIHPATSEGRDREREEEQEETLIPSPHHLPLVSVYVCPPHPDSYFTTCTI